MAATLRNTYKCLVWAAVPLVQISTLLIATPTHLTLTVLDMSGTAGQTTCASPLVFRQPGAVGSSDEWRTRRHGTVLSRTNITYTGRIFSPNRST